MPRATQTSRTGHLLALMTRGDDLFNARDWPALDQVHHADMIAYVTGSAEPIYGREAHGAAMQQLVRMFPDIRVHTPYPIQFGDGDWITVVTNVTGMFTGEMTLPDGTVTPPTGKAFDLEFAQTSKWNGDQLIIISAFWDAALQTKQLGLAQPAAPTGLRNRLYPVRSERLIPATSCEPDVRTYAHDPLRKCAGRVVARDAAYTSPTGFEVRG